MIGSRAANLLRDLGFALTLLVVLLALNLILNPARFHPAVWGTLVGLAAPLIAASLASTPVLLSGRGGIDVSVGPQMAFINAILIKVLFLGLGVASPFLILPALLLVGGAVGLVNGFMAVVLRIQPIVATLGTYLMLTGVTLLIVPAPVGPAPDWIKSLSGPLSIVPLGMICLAWWALSRTPYHDQLMAVGSDDRAAYTAGVSVGAVRILAYVMTGVFAAIAGLALTALIGSADPNIGPTYTLIAIAAAVLGGVSLSGGRGGLTGAAVGAIDIFLLQSLLTTFNVSTFVLQIAYGTILVAAVVLTAVQDRLLARGNA